MMFQGSDYLPERDEKPLKKQIDRIREFMLRVEWATFEEIERVTGYRSSSISAQLRNLHKPEHGGYDKTKKFIRSDGQCRTYAYRIRPAKPVDTLF